ncbi:MAG: DsbA family protein [Candidatus Pacearchaeota archaeon]
MSDNTITIKKDDLWKYSTFALIAIVLIASIFVFTGNTTGNTVQEPSNQQPGKVSASVDDDPVLGDPNAPITIIEFSDYQCPFCGKFWSDTLPSIKSEYIDTGKVNLVYRDFPLISIHPLAQVAGEAVECVRDAAGGSDEVYFKYHDKIFSSQSSLSTANLNIWAQDMGYDISDCLNSGKFTSEVVKDTADAQAAGGRGTPFFVIGDSAISGACPFSTFSQALEAEAAGENWYQAPNTCQILVN